MVLSFLAVARARKLREKCFLLAFAGEAVVKSPVSVVTLTGDETAGKIAHRRVRNSITSKFCAKMRALRIRRFLPRADGATLFHFRKVKWSQSLMQTTLTCLGPFHSKPVDSKILAEFWQSRGSMLDSDYVLNNYLHSRNDVRKFVYDVMRRTRQQR